MGPLDVFLGWQALLLAALCYMLCQLLKSILDAAVGAERRKANRVLTRIVLPAVPPVIGALLGLVLPLPDSLAAWVAEEPLPWLALAARGAWGAAAGQFSDYLYSKVKALVQHERAGGPSRRRHVRDDDGGER